MQEKDNICHCHNLNYDILKKCDKSVMTDQLW